MVEKWEKTSREDQKVGAGQDHQEKLENGGQAFKIKLKSEKKKHKQIVYTYFFQFICNSLIVKNNQSDTKWFTKNMHDLLPEQKQGKIIVRLK